MVLALTLSFSSCSARTTGRAEAPAGDTAQAEAAASPGERAPSADKNGAQARVRIFRGDIGGHPIEMRLQRSGETLSGDYAYDGIGQSLTLKGRIDSQDKLSLQEFDASGKQTGKFTGKLAAPSDEESSATIEGQWSQPNGSHQAQFNLTEQPIEFDGNLRIVTKTISERRLKITASYPQITGSDAPAIAKFNRQAEALVSKAVKEFKEGDPPPGKSDYSASYNILLATNDLISIEIVEDSYGGGAHPNIAFYTLNYDLRTGRELELKDMFKPKADYKKVVQQYALQDMNARAKSDAAKEKEPPGQPDDQLFSPEQLADWSNWTITRNGLYVYFDFPHVIAAYDREFIPYRVIKEQLDPRGPAAAYAGVAR